MNKTLFMSPLELEQQENKLCILTNRKSSYNTVLLSIFIGQSYTNTTDYNSCLAVTILLFHKALFG